MSDSIVWLKRSSQHITKPLAIICKSHLQSQLHFFTYLFEFLHVHLLSSWWAWITWQHKDVVKFLFSRQKTFTMKHLCSKPALLVLCGCLSNMSQETETRASLSSKETHPSEVLSGGMDFSKQSRRKTLWEKAWSGQAALKLKADLFSWNILRSGFQFCQRDDIIVHLVQAVKGMSQFILLKKEKSGTAERILDGRIIMDQNRSQRGDSSGFSRRTNRENSKNKNKWRIWDWKI